MPLFYMVGRRNAGLEPGLYFQSERSDTKRQVKTWTAQDGAELKYIRHQPADPDSASLAFFYLHGIESHGAWFDEAADDLCGHGFDVYCLDRRGSGLNREAQGFPSGHVDSADTVLDDVDAFVSDLRLQYQTVVIIGLSWGGKLALAQTLLRNNRADGLVLITPGIVAKVTLPFHVRLQILVSSMLVPQRRFPIPITPDMFTNDGYFLERMQIDPLRLQEVSARFYFENLRMDYLIKRRILELGDTPVLCVFAGQDQIIDNHKSQEILARGKGKAVQVMTLEDQIHSIQFDAPQRLVEEIMSWARKYRWLT